MTSLTDGPAPWFTADHRTIDTQWADVESAVARGDIPSAAGAWTRFDANLRRHLSMEEEVLFPALEAAGMPHMGPIYVMLMEHDQMRSLLDQMAEFATSADWESLADHGDTLLMVIQQHNVKEEAIVYPMASRTLTGRWPELSEKLAAY